MYKGVRFVRCDSCLSTRNKGHFSLCHGCGVAPPSNVVEQQVLVQRSAHTAGQQFGQLAHVPQRHGPFVVGGAAANTQTTNAQGNGRRRWGNQGGIPDVAFLAISRRPDGTLVGQGKEAKRIAAEQNKLEAQKRNANGAQARGNGRPRNIPAPASATAPNDAVDTAPTEKYTELQLVQIIATLQGDGEHAAAAGYERRLATLRASTAAPKTPSVAHAKRLAEQADTRLDKATAKLDSLMAQIQTAQADTELAALQLQQANATYDKLLDDERANRGTTTSGLTTGPLAPTISIDKIMLGEFQKLDLGSAAG
jgi:hypothetical protein